jgi:hypothetical protein
MKNGFGTKQRGLARSQPGIRSYYAQSNPSNSQQKASGLLAQIRRQMEGESGNFYYAEMVTFG